MSKIYFEMNLSAECEKLFSIATDYQRFQEFFPAQIKSMKIVNQTENEIITEEILTFHSFFKTEMQQRVIHKISKPYKIESHIILGPFKGTFLKTEFENKNGGTKISIDVDVNIGLKYKILSPIIKKRYKTVLIALLYKMNTLAIQD